MTVARAPLVRAAGGVVLRPRKKGGIQVLAVHRPHHDDWSLPKGKLNRGEAWEAAALREVEEESAVKARIVDRLEPTSYWVSNGPKIVVWYRMAIDERNSFEPNDEVDEIKWIWSENLAEELTHDDDLVVAHEALAQFEAITPD